MSLSMPDRPATAKPRPTNGFLAECRRSAVNLERTKARLRKVQALSHIQSPPSETQHMLQTFHAVRFIQAAPPLCVHELKTKAVDLPRRPGWENKKTVVFDLDETLVHCSETLTGAETSLRIDTPDGSLNFGLYVRPHALDLLQAANKHYEVVVFTAGEQGYADTVLDYLDPQKDLIHHRLYRHHCIQVNGKFVKDLRVLRGRALADVLIVDNSAQSFASQLPNGVPIKPWLGDLADTELLRLAQFLAVQSKQEDVRVLNRQVFRLASFCEDFLTSFATV